MTTPLRKKILAGLLLVICTALAFAPSLHNGFVNWDDEDAIVRNPQIRQLTPDGLRTMFTKTVGGSYQPLTTLSFAFEYRAVGLAPFRYHFDNLVLHTTNVLLVFVLIFLLVKRWDVAFATALLFGVSPLRVESVAWATERKDVLFALFYLLGLVFYALTARRKNPVLWHALTFFCFILSLLSKPQAATFPLSMLAIDYLRQPKCTIRHVLSKLPHMIIGALVLLITYHSSAPILAGETNFAGYTVVDRLFFTGTAVVMYLVKILIPFNLCAIYPFPTITPWSAAGVVAALAVTIWAVWRLSRRSKTVLFGVLFFAGTIVLAFSNIWLNQYWMADRYSYLASIGIYLSVVIFADSLLPARRKYLRLIGCGLVIVWAATFAWLTSQRTGVWKDGVTLWSDVARQYPDISVAQENLGVAFFQKGQPSQALEHLTLALQLDPQSTSALYQRARVLHALGALDAAMVDITGLILRKPDDPKSYNEAGMLLRDKRQWEEAINAYNKALVLDPTLSETYNNRGNIYAVQGRDDLAMADYNQALALQPDSFEGHLNRGHLYYLQGKWLPALQDYNKAIALRPEVIQAYVQRAPILVQLGRWDEARRDYDIILTASPDNAVMYYRRSLVEKITGDYPKAIADAKTSKALGYPVPDSYLAELALPWFAHSAK